MAVVNLGSIVADIRGSVGDQTYARNQGGLYVRDRTGPAGAPTASQIEVTDTITDLSQAWSSTLTDAQRAGWRQYAAAYPKANKWGHPILHNGYTRFIKTNFPSYRGLGSVTFDDPPTEPPLPPFAFDISASAATNKVTVALPPTPAPPASDAATAWAYAGLPKSPGVNFYKAPFALASTNLHLLGTWLLNPWRITIAGGLTQGDKIWFRFQLQNFTTGALSSHHTAQCVIGA